MHLYVHIPFCHRICPYCSFYKHTPASTDMNLFVRALLREVESRKDDLQNSPEHEPRTLYFGGGTPSMLSNSHLGKIIQGIDHVVDIASLDEFSFESNPTTFTINKVRAWKDMGINRVSLGIQSWDPRILAVLGRTHTPEIARHSLEMLRTAGIPEINIDLMFAIPGQTLQLWEQTLLQTVEANPEHISAYNLTYEEDTAFFESLAKGEINQDTEHDADYFELADTILTDAGFRHYETSNYARNNLLSKHNFGYWPRSRQYHPRQPHPKYDGYERLHPLHTGTWCARFRNGKIERRGHSPGTGSPAPPHRHRGSHEMGPPSYRSIHHQSDR